MLTVEVKLEMQVLYPVRLLFCWRRFDTTGVTGFTDQLPRFYLITHIDKSLRKMGVNRFDSKTVVYEDHFSPALVIFGACHGSVCRSVT